MKTVALVLLIVAVAGYYFGIDFSELFPTVPKSEAAKERVASQSAPGAQTSSSPGARPSSVPQNQDGSLTDRWKP